MLQDPLEHWFAHGADIQVADVKILLLLTCYVCSFLLFSCSSWGHCDCDCLRGGGFTFNRQVLSRSSLVNVIFQLSGVGARHFSLTPQKLSCCSPVVHVKALGMYFKRTSHLFSYRHTPQAPALRRLSHVYSHFKIQDCNMHVQDSRLQYACMFSDVLFSCYEACYEKYTYLF